MDKPEFLKQQYLSIREEIKETRARIFTMASVGIMAMPAFYFLADAYKIDLLILTLPIIICIIVILYLSEMHAMMRCGRYIRTVIEPNIKDVIGWETWLETNEIGDQDRRKVEKLVTYFFYLIFLIYYLASVNLSAQYASTKFGIEYAWILCAFYTGLGIVFGFQLVQNWRFTTSTKVQR